MIRPGGWGLVAVATMLLTACNPPSVPGLGKPQAPTSLAAMDAARSLPGSIYFIQGGRVWRLRGGNLTALTSKDQTVAYPAVTSDGQKTAVALVANGHSEIAVGGPNFANLTSLTKASKNLLSDSIDIKPTFSPDGTRLAFMSDRGKCCTDEQIWEGAWSPYRPHQVSFPPDLSGGDDAPAYQPSGAALTFVGWRSASNDARNVHGELMEATVPSGRPRVLQALADADLLDPAPGATGQLAFVLRRGGSSDIEVGGPDGSGATTITSFGDTRQPVWSPDGKTLLFLSHHGGTFDLWSISADGRGNPKRLTWGADIDANSRPAWIARA